MLRKIVFVLVLLAFAAGLGWFFLQYEEAKAPMNDALVAIPSDAALIIQANQPRATFTDLGSSNVLWAELTQTNAFQRIDGAIHTLDSLLTARETVAFLIQEKPLFISAHKAGGNAYNWLFSISLPPAADHAKVHTAIRDLAHGAISSKTYDEATIYSVPGPEKGAPLTYAIYHGIFVASYSSLLVEDAVRQLNSGSSLTDDPAFAKVQSTAGAKSHANVFVKHGTLPGVINTYLAEGPAETLRGFANYAGWSELDLAIKPNTIMLNGFTVAPDSMQYYLSLFDRQSPQDLEMLRILPSNTATLIHFGYSDFGTFLLNYRSWLQARNKLYEYEEAIGQINSKYGINLALEVLSWVDKEVALVLTEPTDDALADHTFMVLRTNNKTLAHQSLSDLVTAVDAINESTSDSLKYRGYRIRQLAIPKLFKALFGDLFSGMSGNYFAEVGDYVVFANTAAALKHLIKKFETEKTLAQDANFRAFSEHLSEESNIFVYSNVARSPAIYQSFLTRKWAKELESQLEVYRKFEAVAIQVSADRDGMFYNSVYLKHNPVYKQETGSLWELAMDTVVARKPWLVQNHRTRQGEVLVQDVGNTLALISNLGKPLWQRSMDEAIIGDVQQIDAYENGKLQYLFATSSRLWLVDRNGKDVGAFPIDLPDNATAAPACMDYDRNKRYRILVPCVDGKVYNYSAKGGPVKGWSFSTTGAPVVQKPLHFAAEGKDYIVFVDREGTIYATDRKGNERMPVTATLPNRQTAYLQAAETLDKSCMVSTDSAGNVVRVYFNNDTETVHLSEFTDKHYFLYANADGQEGSEYVFADGNRLSVYGADESLLFSQEFDAPVSAMPQFFRLADNAPRIGVVTGQTSEIWLLNGLGMIHEGLPLSGATAFAIGDFNNDGSFDVVVGNHDKNLYTYTLE